MRGSRVCTRADRGRGGSIPAHAGQPTSDDGVTCDHRVDPRACGAAYGVGSRERHSAGRSPRMRGSLDRRSERVSPDGSIPAHAGQPEGQTIGSRLSRVDPRACGAALATAHAASSLRGRSPRMRGSPGRIDPAFRESGSIPAHAGQPPASPSPTGCAGVDPRACGAATRGAVREVYVPGRSPRMRGSRWRDQRGSPRCGSIPAHAGQPGALASARPRCWVDPRACGAAGSEMMTANATAGRSPRMRGSPETSLRS